MQSSRSALLVFLSLGLAALASAAEGSSLKPDSDKGEEDSSATVTQSAHRRIRFGGLMVGVGYSSGPFYSPFGYYPPYFPGYWGLYDPIWYSPFVHPGLYTGFLQGPNMGELKLKTASKDASLYVDGAFAGLVEKLKKFWLAPGVYNIEVRDPSDRAFRQRVYVLSGKTLEIHAALIPESQKETR